MCSISPRESRNQLQIALLWEGFHWWVPRRSRWEERQRGMRILWADNYLLCPSQSLPNSMTFKEFSRKHGWGSYICDKDSTQIKDPVLRGLLPKTLYSKYSRRQGPRTKKLDILYVSTLSRQLSMSTSFGIGPYLTNELSPWLSKIYQF